MENKWHRTYSNYVYKRLEEYGYAPGQSPEKYNRYTQINAIVRLRLKELGLNPPKSSASCMMNENLCIASLAVVDSILPSPSETKSLHKKLYAMISQAKHVIATMNVEGFQNDEILDRETDKGMKLLEAMEKEIADLENGYVISRLGRQSFPLSTSWVETQTGTLPKPSENVFIMTKSGQVGEGFLVQKDYSKPFETPNEKIDFEDYEDGPHWFRYRFRDILDEKSVIAWASKEEKPFECDSETCAFAHNGICKCYVVHGRRPVITDDGCTEWVLDERKVL